MREDLRNLPIDPGATQLLTAAQSHTLRALVVRKTDSEVQFATDRGEGEAWLAVGVDIEFLLRAQIEPILVTEESLDWALKKYHPAPKFPRQTRLDIERALLSMPEEDRPWITVLKVVVMDVLRSRMQFVRVERPSKMWYGKFREGSREERLWTKADGAGLIFDPFESALKHYAAAFSNKGKVESCLLLFWGDWVVTCSIEMGKARIDIALTVDKSSL